VEDSEHLPMSSNIRNNINDSGVAASTKSPQTVAKPGHRLKILPKIETTMHRYVHMRYLSQWTTVGILFAVPLTGLARVDLYTGNNRLLFHNASWREGLAGAIVGIALLYVVTFLINLAFGRMFCGWGCPVGFLNRLNDVAELKPHKNTPTWQRIRDRMGPLGHSFILVFPSILWWTSAKAFIAGFTDITFLAWGTTILGVAAIYALGKYARWKFCMTTCPIGLYYSFVAPGDHFGIHFREATKDNSKDACLHCNACINVCPVDLNPMDLARNATPRGGIAIEAPGQNHCLKCGDCIQACEMMIHSTAKKRGITEVPLKFGFFHGPQRITREQEPIENNQQETDTEDNPPVNINEHTQKPQPQNRRRA